MVKTESLRGDHVDHGGTMVGDHTYLISWNICVSVGGSVTWRARWVMWKHSVMKLKSPGDRERVEW